MTGPLPPEAQACAGTTDRLARDLDVMMIPQESYEQRCGPTRLVISQEAWVGIDDLGDPGIDVLGCGPGAARPGGVVQAVPEVKPVALMGPVQPYPFVAVYLVKNDEVLAAMADGFLTIGELEALPSLKIGHATFFQEINGPGQYTSPHYELTASGTLAEDASKTFSVHFTCGGRFAKAPKTYPNLAQAEIRFGQ